MRDRCVKWHFKAYRRTTFSPNEEKSSFIICELETDRPFTPKPDIVCEAQSLPQLKLKAAIEHGISADDVNWWSVDPEKCISDIQKMRKTAEICI